MAYVSRFSDVVKPAVAGESIQEGRAVSLGASGVRRDLAVAMLAASGVISNVYVAMVPPDDYARPTDSRLYTMGNTLNFNQWSNTAYSDPVHTSTLYDVGKSALWNPTLLSGELLQAHRGGSYAVPSGAYVDSAAIKVPGAKIAVTTSGQWIATANEGNAVGTVDEYNAANGVLIFTLKQ